MLDRVLRNRFPNELPACADGSLPNDPYTGATVTVIERGGKFKPVGAFNPGRVFGRKSAALHALSMRDGVANPEYPPPVTVVVGDVRQPPPADPTDGLKEPMPEADVLAASKVAEFRKKTRGARSGKIVVPVPRKVGPS